MLRERPLVAFFQITLIYLKLVQENTGPTISCFIYKSNEFYYEDCKLIIRLNF